MPVRYLAAEPVVDVFETYFFERPQAKWKIWYDKRIDCMQKCTHHNDYILKISTGFFNGPTIIAQILLKIDSYDYLLAVNIFFVFILHKPLKTIRIKQKYFHNIYTNVTLL